MNTQVIGYIGENGARDIRIPIAHLLEKWPGMTPTLCMVPVGASDTDAYLLDADLDGADLVWHVSAADTVSAGTTKATIRLVDASGRIALDEPFQVIISENIYPGGQPPVAVVPWVDKLSALAERASTAAANADAAAGRANEAAGKWDESSAEKLGQRIDNLVGSDDETVKNADMLGGKPSGWYHQDCYEGANLKTVFASAEDLAANVRAGDFSKIRVGDYWPITLNGTIYDYAEAANKTLSNAIIKLEVAGVNFYSQYGDTGVPQNHLLFCSHDLLPWRLRFRSGNTTWYDAEATNPWLGSHLYQTLNNPSNGLLPLVAATDIGAYIYAGPNGNGMRFLGETKGPTATTATSWAWDDRGKLFLPSEREVWGGDTWSEHGYDGLTLQWPIFAGTMRHIIKGLGNGGSRCAWWCCSSFAGNSGDICYVDYRGYPSRYSAADTGMGAPVCFLIA